LLVSLLGISTFANATEVCPARKGQPLRFVDVFDGPTEEMATLVPDQDYTRSGYWQLRYVYESSRFVTIRCKYADGAVLDIKLIDKVDRCDYKINAKKALTINCK
jgi:hypothetical protein